MSDDLSDGLSSQPSLGTDAASAPVVAKSSVVSVPVSWFDQDDMLRTLWRDDVQPAVIADKLGRSVAAVMTRAVRLGLPRRAAPGRKPGYKHGSKSETTKRKASSVSRAGAPKVKEDPESRQADPAMRVCLMCLKKFSSEGRHNRICPLCKGTAGYTKASSLPNSGFVDSF